MKELIKEYEAAVEWLSSPRTSMAIKCNGKKELQQYREYFKKHMDYEMYIRIDWKKI